MTAWAFFCFGAAAFWGALAGWNGHYMIVKGSVPEAALFGMCVAVSLGYLIVAARELWR